MDATPCVVLTLTEVLQDIVGCPPAGVIPLGKLYYVDSEHDSAADNAAYGLSPEAPFATVDYAIGQCKNDRLDVIIVAQRHSETGAAGITLDKENVVMLGMGPLRYGPSCNGDVVFSAEGCTLYNFRLPYNAGGDTDPAVEFTEDHCKLLGCSIYGDGGGSYQLRTGIELTGDRNDIVIAGNFVDATVGSLGGCEAGILLSPTSDVDRIMIVGNTLYGDWTNAAIYQNGNDDLIGCVIQDNMIYNTVDTAAHSGFINTNPATDGWATIQRNVGYANEGVGEALLTVAEAAKNQNYVTIDLTLSGQIAPSTS